MDLSDLYGASYLIAADLQGKAYRTTIEKIDIVTMHGDQKPKAVLMLSGISKGLVMNKTRARSIAEKFTWNREVWIGREIEIFSTKVEFQGKLVDAIRVPTQQVAGAPVQPAVLPPVQPVPVQLTPVQPAATVPVQQVATVPVQPAVLPPVQPAPVQLTPVQPAAAQSLPVAAPPVSPMAALQAMSDDIPY